MNLLKIAGIFFILSVFTNTRIVAQQGLPAVPFVNSAQNQSLPLIACSYDVNLYRLRKDPAFVLREEKMNREIVIAQRNTTGDTITLPVVVHIINANPASITDQQVINGIKDLNDAFGKSGIYAGSAGADTKIRFCLTKKDPDGGISNGITRTASFFSDHQNMENEDGRLKNLIQWDPSRYVNIWLVASIEGESYADFSCGVWYRQGVGGYATMPPGGGPLDGIVTTGFGSVLAHEMGHYLGLYHTFEGGCRNNNCQNDGDKVCDTPPDNSVRPSPACNSPFNSCDTDTLSNYSNGFFHTDVPDQVANFMDYGNAACSRQFTQGQADRMRATINTQRSGLLQDECSPPCSANILAAFTRDVAYPVAGEVINFTNSSSTVSTYQWLIDGSMISTGSNFSYTFNTAGKYKVTLKAFNNAGCFASYTDYVIVSCGVTARFYTDKKTIASKTNILTDTILFTNTSYNAQSYKWLMSNDQGMAEQVVSRATNLNYVFPTPATYSIRLVATNGSCSDTTDVYTVPNLDPTADGFLYGINAYCYQQTKIKVDFCIADFGFAPIPANTPVTFYDANPQAPGAHKLSPTFYLPFESPGGNCGTCHSLIVDVGYAHLDNLFMVFNDSGNAIPVVLPNRPLVEKFYDNNIASVSNLRFRVTTQPTSATLEPGDTLQLAAIAQPAIFGGSSSFLWSDPYRLSCTTCSRPFLYADSDRVKRVIATSFYGCKDTAYVDIKVPPADDYIIQLNKVVCASPNSMTVDFTVNNLFHRGVIPKDLKVTFYSGNPATSSAVILPPVFSVPDTVFRQQASYTTAIQLVGDGELYAVVNDSSLAIPVTLPNTDKTEKIFGNNVDSFAYRINRSTIDTAICEGNVYRGYKTAGTYTDTLQGYNGCDSIRTLHLTIIPVINQNISAPICEGKSYRLPSGRTVFTAGLYLDTIRYAGGCDSLISHVDLFLQKVLRVSIDKVICEGQTYVLPSGVAPSATGTYIDTVRYTSGCDSVITTLALTVKPVERVQLSAAICFGQTYTMPTGFTVNSTGIYNDTFYYANGCDSVVTTVDLTVQKAIIINPVVSLCVGQQYTLPSGRVVTLTGFYRDTVRSTLQCDSLITNLSLTMNPNPVVSVTKANDINCILGNTMLTASGGTGYKWSPAQYVSNPNIYNPVASPPQSMVFTVHVASPFGCTTADSIEVVVNKGDAAGGYLLASAFTPNNDGKNDCFGVKTWGFLTDLTFNIYNRDGLLVFQTSDPARCWDGTYKGQPQATAAFVYYIGAKTICGPISRKGTVLLIR